MGTLVRNITKASDAKYGVNFLDLPPPASPIGAVSRKIGIVGDFPWGAPNVARTCYSFDDFMSFFAPKAFATGVSGSEACKAFVGAKFPGPIVVVRIDANGAVARSSSYTVSGGAWVGTCPYKGALGNDVTVTWAAATDADGTHRNLTISIGTAYSVLYENVTTATLTTLGDPYITWTASSSPSALPAAAAAATSTTAGANGTAVAGDYVGSSVSNVGIRLFYGAGLNVNALVVPECPSALVAAVNAGLKAYADDAGKNGIAILCSVASQSASAAATYASSFANTASKVAGIWPRVSVTDTRVSTFPTITIDANMMFACACVGVDPWESPEGVNSLPYFTAVTALETDTATDTAYAAINDGGMSALFIDDTLGPLVRGAVVTNTTSGQTDVVRSMYRSYFAENVAGYAIRYVGVPLQVDLTNNRLGERVRPLYDSIVGFCADEQVKGHINGYTVDPFGANVEADIDAGTWTIATAIDTYAPLRTLIIQTQIGSTVVTSS